MKQQIFAIIALVLASGILPSIALAQTAAAPAVTQPGAATGGHWVLLQGTGRHDTAELHWYYVTPNSRNFQPPYRPGL